MVSPLRTITFPSGESVPALGQGTWNMGDSAAVRAAELDALRSGLDAGLRLIDTAEMYGGGASESLVGEAIQGRRDEAFVVSKVLPSHASFRGTVDACQASLRRLGIERIDLYLLHWRGRVPLEETVEAFDHLVAEGLIGSWGVSNFDSGDLDDLDAVLGRSADGSRPQTDQVLYNLTRRGPEFDLLPRCVRDGMPVMAYSPVEQGRLIKTGGLQRFAASRGVTSSQVALAWAMREGNVIAIPKASTVHHVRENFEALAIELTPDDLAELDAMFTPPGASSPLEMI